jgi:CRISPR/Cas system-associated exonuclease Cas4 (RecB family)
MTATKSKLPAANIIEINQENYNEILGISKNDLVNVVFAKIFQLNMDSKMVHLTCSSIGILIKENFDLNKLFSKIAEAQTYINPSQIKTMTSFISSVLQHRKLILNTSQPRNEKIIKISKDIKELHLSPLAEADPEITDWKSLAIQLVNGKLTLLMEEIEKNIKV